MTKPSVLGSPSRGWIEPGFVFIDFVSDIEMPEEETHVTVGAVQWGVMSPQGLETLLNVTHMLFTKVGGHITHIEMTINNHFARKTNLTSLKSRRILNIVPKKQSHMFNSNWDIMLGIM